LKWKNAGCVYSKKRTGEPLNKLLCEVERKRKEPTRGEGHYGQIEKGGYGVRRVGFEFWGEGLFSNNQKNL